MRNLLRILPVVILLAACHDYKKDVEQKDSENQDLMTANEQQDSTIAFFIDEMNEIEANLNAIDTSKRNVEQSTKNPDLRRTQLVRINENIANIKDLMQQNKEKLEALNKRLKASGSKVKGLEKLMATLNLQIEEKDKQIAELNTAITSLNTTINDQKERIILLVEEGIAKDKVVYDQTSQLNTAYYVINTQKNLLDKQILIKEGGIIKRKVVKSNVDNSGFTQIDITKTNVLPIDAKDAKLLTLHPASSYTIKRTDKKHVSQLEITNPQEFWKTSKYLIVQIDK